MDANKFIPDTAISIVGTRRTIYAEAIARQKRWGLSPIMLPGFLRSEVVLDIDQQVQFPIRSDETANGQPVQKQERRLNINDAFYPTEFSVMFYTFVTATGNPARVRAPLQTFENGSVFGANAPEVGAAYRGVLGLQVDSTTIIPALDMDSFRYVDQAQQGVAGALRNAWEGDKAFRSITDPLIRLNGPGDNRLVVTFPDSLDFTLVAGSNVVAVLYMRGWIAQNGGGFRPAQK